jgi:hypothetical protein
MHLNSLDQPYRRILYMVEHISTSDALKEALRVTTKDLVGGLVDSPEFIDLLAEKKQPSE